MTKLLFAIAFLFLPTTASAASVTVDCTGSTPGPFTSIGAALATLDNIGPHTITVIGSCVENVNLFQRDRVTIQAPVTQTATISAANPNAPVFNLNGSHNIVLRRLVISDGGTGVIANNVSNLVIEGTVIQNSTGNGLQLVGNTTAVLGGNNSAQFVIIRNHGAAGISVNGSFAQINGGLTIENNGGIGITIAGGRLIVNGNVQENLIRGNGFGVNINGAHATFSGQNTIQNNGATGVQAALGGSVVFTAIQLPDGSYRVNVIEGHKTIGLHVAAAASASLAGPNIIRNNGSVGFEPDEIHGGVNVGTVSRIQFSGGNQITDNIGPGVTSRFNGAVALGDSIVTNNAEQGLLLLRQSVGLVDTGASLSGNGSANVFCDTTSLVAGDLTGISQIDCSKIERALGPPRPGKFKDQQNPMVP